METRGAEERAEGMYLRLPPAHHDLLVFSVQKREVRVVERWKKMVEVL